MLTFETRNVLKQEQGAEGDICSESVSSGKQHGLSRLAYEAGAYRVEPQKLHWS